MDDIWIVLFLISMFIFFCMLLYRPSIQIKKPQLGVPWAKMIYTDQKQKKSSASLIQHKILSSEKYGVRGKPDYIFQRYISGSLIPVELKSGTISKKNPLPNPGDLMQLAVYFLIIEDVYGKRPKQGRLIYKNYMFIIKNTKKLRTQVLTTLEDMRKMLETGDYKVDSSFIKCKSCICKETVCEYYQYRD